MLTATSPGYFSLCVGASALIKDLARPCSPWLLRQAFSSQIDSPPLPLQVLLASLPTGFITKTFIMNKKDKIARSINVTARELAIEVI